MQSDADARADYDRQEGFHVGDLAAAGIEREDKQEPADRADASRGDDLRRDDDGVPRAAMRIGQVPLATGTGGHQFV